jgi:hypothetical protein
MVGNIPVSAGMQIRLPSKCRHAGEIAKVTGIAEDAIFTERGVALIADLTEDSVIIIPKEQS